MYALSPKISARACTRSRKKIVYTRLYTLWQIPICTKMVNLVKHNSGRLHAYWMRPAAYHHRPQWEINKRTTPHIAAHSYPTTSTTMHATTMMPIWCSYRPYNRRRAGLRWALCCSAGAHALNRNWSYLAQAKDDRACSPYALAHTVSINCFYFPISSFATCTITP